MRMTIKNIIKCFLIFCSVLVSCSGDKNTKVSINYTTISKVAKSISNKSFNPSTLLWHKKPAVEWENAFPVGNGRLGAMIYGGIKEEKIQLNEDTYWSGGPYSTVVKGGYKELPKSM